jgi:hypothetical protein
MSNSASNTGYGDEDWIEQMISRPHDTTPGAWSQYHAVLDGMDAAARLNAAVELSDAVREIRLAGMAARHPELAPDEVVARLVSEDYGVSLPSPK